MKILRRSLAFYLATSTCVLALQAGRVAYAQTDQAVSFNITGPNLASALTQFAQQSNRQIIFANDAVVTQPSKPLRGSYQVQEALEMLLRGSGLEYRVGPDSTIIVAKTPTRAAAASSGAIRVAAAATTTAVNTSGSANEPREVEEIVVTGSRIVRDGYEAPTPLTVVGVEQMQQSASPNLLTFLNDLPALAGTSLTTNNGIATTSGQTGTQGANMRSLGRNRTLVLLDGQRIVGISADGVANIGSLPSQLVERVDVVTGGTSAVYGSDAVAGVMNFILDKDFTGVKAEVSGGVTNHGDDKNYKINVSTGFGFAGGRGHVLLSGEHTFNEGTEGDGGRAWNRTGLHVLNNPNYTPTNGQPQRLLLNEVGVSVATAGGIIVSGPLKGTAFGPGGIPYQFRYGELVANPFMALGGDWESTDVHRFFDLQPRQTQQNVFTRFSYDLTESVTAYVQANWSQLETTNDVNYSYIYGGPVGTSPTIRIDNPYIPAMVRAAMVANNITSFQLGSRHEDIGEFRNDNLLISKGGHAGLDGSLDAFDTTWTWNLNYGYGLTDQNARNFPGIITSLYYQAIDAVADPSTGRPICRIALTNPATACKPFNVMGVGVNDINNAAYFLDPSRLNSMIELTTYSAAISGDPFSLWAGPVSLAASFEHRIDSVRSEIDRYSAVFDRINANFPSVNGRRTVTEGALETVIPLAQGESWAQAWDVTAAVRFTDYSTSGYVTTWKLGTTYTLSDDIRFRITQSRDIRAPNLLELFTTPNGTSNVIIDRFVNGQAYNVLGLNSSNVNLLPEKADTTGIGVVLSPTFINGFTASVDYWNVGIKGAIQGITIQQVIDSCFTGQFPQLCSNIVRSPATGLITTVTYFPINLAIQEVRGIDFDMSYRTQLADWVDGLDGSLTLRGLLTTYLRNYQDNTFNPPIDRVGQNGMSNTLPDWKLTATASYNIDRLTVSLKGRAVSSGVFDKRNIVCTSGCPTSTTDRPTINEDFIAGRFYVDANVTYGFDIGGTTTSELFLSVQNMFNVDPPRMQPGSPIQPVVMSSLYDVMGAVYRAGVRFRM